MSAAQLMRADGFDDEDAWMASEERGPRRMLPEQAAKKRAKFAEALDRAGKP